MPAADGPDGEVPEWVLRSGSHSLARARARATGQSDQFARVKAEAQAWCAERGLSYCMTVMGWARPSSSEAAVGLTRGAGPTYAARCAERARRTT